MEVLGIDLKLIIAQIINFAILFFLLRKFLFGPLGGMIEDRSAKIDKGLKDAEIASSDRQKAEESAAKIEEKALSEASEMLKKSKTEASKEAAAILKKANEQADKLMSAAKAEASEAKGKALKEARSEISDIVVIALDKIVGNELTPEQKSNLTSKAIIEL